MKKLVIYYSHDGNTKFIAETIAREINADITELKTKKTMNASGLMKVGWGVRQLVSQSEPILLTMEKNPADYDLIIIGSPVWTYTFAPPIRTFLKNWALLLPWWTEGKNTRKHEKIIGWKHDYRRV